MNKYVVDAGVVIKWYLPEDYSECADRLLNPENELIVPDLLFSEIGNIAWKHVTRNNYSHNKAVTILKALEFVPFQVWSAKSLLEYAFDVACLTKRTFYDSLYVSLAEITGCKMVTADRKLFNALEYTRFHKHILWIEEIQE